MNMATKQKIKLSIIIPALNEELRIGDTLLQLSGYLETNSLMKKIPSEVIVVAADGGDNTVAVARKHASKFDSFRILQPGNPVGKGRDVKVGMLAARGEVVVFMDADLATPLRHLAPAYKKIISGADVVIGTRNLRKHHKSILRRTLSNTGNLAFRIFGGVWVEDSQCGFKMFNKKASDLCFEKLTIKKWGFDMEVLAIAQVNRLKIETIRVNDWKHVEGGNFDGDVIKHAKDTLIDLLVIFKNRVSGAYKTR